MEMLEFSFHSCGWLHNPTGGNVVSRPVQFHRRLLCNIDHNNGSENPLLHKFRV